MIKKISNPTKVPLFVAGMFGLMISIAMMSGCGPSVSDEPTLDRVPNVPPSTRSLEDSRVPSNQKR